jgi:hypothetical protein
VFGKNAEKVGENCLLCGLALFVPILNLYAVTTIRGLIRELCISCAQQEVMCVRIKKVEDDFVIIYSNLCLNFIG